MLWCRRESNPYFNHGAQLHGLPDVSGNKLFAVVILKLLVRTLGFEPRLDNV